MIFNLRKLCFWRSCLVEFILKWLVILYVMEKYTFYSFLSWNNIIPVIIVTMYYCYKSCLEFYIFMSRLWWCGVVMDMEWWWELLCIWYHVVCYHSVHNRWLWYFQGPWYHYFPLVGLRVSPWDSDTFPYSKEREPMIRYKLCSL